MALRRPTETQVIEDIESGSPGATKVFLNKIDSRIGHLVGIRGYEPFIKGLEKVSDRATRGRACSMDAKRFLKKVSRRLQEVQDESLYFSFLLERIKEFNEGDTSALLFCYREADKGGRPRKYSELEFAAFDIYLRDYVGMLPEEANEFLMTIDLPTQEEESVDNLIDRRFIQRLRKKYDHRYANSQTRFGLAIFDRDLLLHNTGSLQSSIPKV